MEITPDKLLQIIGSQQVEIFLLRAQLEQLRNSKPERTANVEPFKKPGDG